MLKCFLLLLFFSCFILYYILLYIMLFSSSTTTVAHRVVSEVNAIKEDKSKRKKIIFKTKRTINEMSADKLMYAATGGLALYALQFWATLQAHVLCTFQIVYLIKNTWNLCLVVWRCFGPKCFVGHYLLQR